MKSKPLRRNNLKPERLPWREKMTLCLLAECLRDGKDCVLAAYDLNAENEWVSADIQHKGYRLRDDCFVMMAGAISKAVDLGRCCALEIDEGRETGRPCLDSLQIALVAYKKKLANEYVGLRLGISYDEFLENGKERLPEEAFREIVAEVKNIGIGCSLLILEFSDETSQIFRITESGVEMCFNFAAIGTGIVVAESLLFLREHNDNIDVGEALFHVWEAMRWGSRVPGVGESFTIDILSMKNGKLHSEELTEEYEEHLEKLVNRYSVRSPKHIEYKKDFIRPTGYANNKSSMAKSSGAGK